MCILYNFRECSKRMFSDMICLTLSYMPCRDYFMYIRGAEGGSTSKFKFVLSPKIIPLYIKHKTYLPSTNGSVSPIYHFLYKIKKEIPQNTKEIIGQIILQEQIFQNLIYTSIFDHFQCKSLEDF